MSEQAETINHPAHYKGASPIAYEALTLLGVYSRSLSKECIEALEQCSAGVLKNAYAFSACKYLWRCEHKGRLIEDLKKAAWYLERGITLDQREFDGIGKGFFSPPWIRHMSRCLEEVQSLIAEQEVLH